MLPNYNLIIILSWYNNWPLILTPPYKLFNANKQILYSHSNSTCFFFRVSLFPIQHWSNNNNYNCTLIFSCLNNKFEIITLFKHMIPLYDSMPPLFLFVALHNVVMINNTFALNLVSNYFFPIATLNKLSISIHIITFMTKCFVFFSSFVFLYSATHTKLSIIKPTN